MIRGAFSCQNLVARLTTHIVSSATKVPEENHAESSRSEKDAPNPRESLKPSSSLGSPSWAKDERKQHQKRQPQRSQTQHGLQIRHLCYACTRNRDSAKPRHLQKHIRERFQGIQS